MQMALQCNGMLVVTRSVQQRAVCRLPAPAQQQHHHFHNSTSTATNAVAAGSLPSVEQEAVASSSVPEAAANGVQKSGYSRSLPSDIKRVLFSEQQVREKVAELAAQICKDYKGKPLAIIGVLNGAFIFTSDLVREVSKEIPDVKVDFMRASSYGAASESSGSVQVKHVSDLSKWDHYHILLVEDIIDSGHTLARLSTVLKDAGADTVKVVALLDKKGRRRVEFFPDYVGWECPNAFIVGYGLDYNESFRCLPYLAELKEEAYADSAGH